MRTIWKFELESRHGHHLVPMPRGAQIITVNSQHDALRIWAIVDPKAPVATRGFAVMHTGAPLIAPVDKSNHLASVLMQEGHYVVHVFEIFP